MAISLEIPKKLQALQQQTHQVAQEVLRPISRKYDLAEHEYPKELDMLAALIDGMNDSDSSSGAGATSGSAEDKKKEEPRRRRRTTASAATAPTWPRSSRSARCAGAMSACC